MKFHRRDAFPERIVCIARIYLYYTPFLGVIKRLCFSIRESISKATDMSEYDHSHFLQPLTADKILAGLNAQQQRELRDFYNSHHRLDVDSPLRYDDIRQQFPHVAFYLTAHAIFVALRHTATATTHPLAHDMFIDTCAKDEHHMRQETYKIVDLTHSIPQDIRRMDRIMYAEGEKTKKRIVIELARRATWIELDAHGAPVEYPLMPYNPESTPPFS